MTYRSLLVVLDQGPTCVARTDVALRLAATLDAHVVGLAPTGIVDLPMWPEADPAVGEFATRAASRLQAQAEQAAERFRERCGSAGTKSFEAVVDAADAVPSVIGHGHCSDLVILTQARPDTPGHAATRELVEQVVLQSARPTLLLPYTGALETLGRRPLVAWDDSREAARALWDALPLLRLAEQVEVVSWKESSAIDDARLTARLEALNRWLLWHGVASRMHTEVSVDIGIAEAMLSRAADLSADLIVMGAYGHARWTERMLGGATRGLLEAMTVPVLMSH
jgi:nucleotide-binding universal stress UspA family protein